MAANYIQEIRTVQPHGPYFIGGHSLGGIIVFEIALQLYNQGEKVALLAIFDTEAPSHQNSVSMAESPVYQKLIKTTSEHFYQLSKLAFKNKINYIWERLDWNLKVGKFNSVYKFYLRYIKRAVAELPLLDLARSNLIAYAKYVPSIYSGKLTLFFSTDRDRELEPDDDLGWNGLVTGGVELYECPGKHTTVMQEPNVKVMAEKLIICLRKAQENSSGNKL
jgi:thioesterase domain-containing protein